MWTATASLGPPRTEHTATLLDDGRVLVVGGTDRVEYYTADLVASAELYDAASQP